jgi:hydrogenase maturation protein HypF
VTEARVVRVTGVVQGVGFRPFVHRLAERHGLAGAVRNASGEVEIEIEGPEAELEAFLRELVTEAPPLARIDHIEQQPAIGGRRSAFAIERSRAPTADSRLPVPPDAALCAACEAELLDPGNRRHRYPFITCTDCGPRYTVIEALPYDRGRTSMQAFTQCPSCRAEYENPLDRRYHSETNSCPACGPRLWLEPPAADLGDPIAAAAGRLVAGEIVAIRGLGGFHLAVDATNDQAVRRLRARKHREAKPLAVMVATLAAARAVAHVADDAAALLTSRERPIVLLPRRADGPLAPAVAPGLDTVGVMLAYTPLHRLLLDRVGRPLVMTSGNATDEPIATGLDDARRRLTGIADCLVLHDREILARYDDSVVRLVAGAPLPLRRARGYAPLALALPVAAPEPLVAVGPHLKNTFTLASGRNAYVSPHIGDLENLATLEHFQDTLDAFRRLFHITPAVAVRDLHPDYLSTRVANDLGLPTIGVQHHHAHIAAVLGEYGVTESVVGIAFDGTGFGADGHIWGAEFLIADLRGYSRVAHLREAPLPGGDLAARLPWRAAAGYLSLDPAAAPAFAAAFANVPPVARAIAERQAAVGLNAPPASSMGRLFDAAAAVLGVRQEAAYEGQAAMELETLAGDVGAAPLPLPARRSAGTWELDPMPLLTALGMRRAAGEPVVALAAAFHESIAAAAADLAAQLASDAGLDVVALGGGCFQNARLLGSLTGRLARSGLRVLIPRQLPPNDGAVSYGQAVVAAARLAAGDEVVLCA